jgi:hypothetical protein
MGDYYSMNTGACASATDGLDNAVSSGTGMTTDLCSQALDSVFFGQIGCGVGDANSALQTGVGDCLTGAFNLVGDTSNCIQTVAANYTQADTATADSFNFLSACPIPAAGTSAVETGDLGLGGAAGAATLTAGGPGASVLVANGTGTAGSAGLGSLMGAAAAQPLAAAATDQDQQQVLTLAANAQPTFPGAGLIAAPAGSGDSAPYLVLANPQSANPTSIPGSDTPAADGTAWWQTLSPDQQQQLASDPDTAGQVGAVPGVPDAVRDFSNRVSLADDIASTQGQIDNLNGQYSALQSQITALQNAPVATSTDPAQALGLIEGQQAQIAQLQAQQAQLQAQLSPLQAQLGNLQTLQTVIGPSPTGGLYPGSPGSEITSWQFPGSPPQTYLLGYGAATSDTSSLVPGPDVTSGSGTSQPGGWSFGGHAYDLVGGGCVLTNDNTGTESLTCEIGFGYGADLSAGGAPAGSASTGFSAGLFARVSGTIADGDISASAMVQTPVVGQYPVGTVIGSGSAGFNFPFANTDSAASVEGYGQITLNPDGTVNWGNTYHGIQTAGSQGDVAATGVYFSVPLPQSPLFTPSTVTPVANPDTQIGSMPPVPYSYGTFYGKDPLGPYR